MTSLLAEWAEPTDAELWGLAPDPDSDPPDSPDPDLDIGAPVAVACARLVAERAVQAAAEAQIAPVLALYSGAGTLPRDCSGGGAGFADGGVLDTLEPGAVLAGFTQDAHARGLDELSDDELIGVLRAWRRLASWSAAGQYAAVSELAARRQKHAAALGLDLGQTAAAVEAELACALTLTSRGAQTLLGRADELARLPATAGALATGVIDDFKARVITGELDGLGDEDARRVEARLLAKASRLTSGELRAAARRAVLATDPAAARRRQEKAQRGARVEAWCEPSGTASIAGRDLPPAEVLAADQRIDALARQLKRAGIDCTMDQLRAHVYLALLSGTPVQELFAAGDHTAGDHAAGDCPAGAKLADGYVASGCGAGDHGAGDHGADSCTAGGCTTGDAAISPGGGPDVTQDPACDTSAVRPASADPARLPVPVVGRINLTMSLVTLLGLAEAPGEVGGFGPVDASTARRLAHAVAAGQPTRWCLTITGEHGQAIGHGCAVRGHPPRPGAWSLTFDVQSLASRHCQHERETPGYEPSPSLRHLIEIRDTRCAFPGCRRPATQCDQDHTIPYTRGGLTCECNVAPLCRFHHKIKQTRGWTVTQPEPGILRWVAPSGRAYTSRPGSRAP